VHGEFLSMMNWQRDREHVVKMDTRSDMIANTRMDHKDSAADMYNTLFPLMNASP